MTGTDLVVQDVELAPATLFGTDDPAAVLERQTAIATTLADVVRKQNLVVKIGQSEHVRVEGWTFLGSLLGVFPVVEWTRVIYADMTGEAPGRIGWEARVEARTRGGEVVGAAESQCLRTEKTWEKRDDYALRSMAQTRAVSKALRLPLGFVMQLAGFDPTPADEMPAAGDPPSSGDPAAGTPFADDGEVEPKYISRDQQVRLFAIADAYNVPKETLVRDIVREYTGQSSTKLIPDGGPYERIIAAIQNAGTAAA